MKKRTATTYDIIHLADDEWGSDLMAEIARDHFDKNPDCHFVEVIEHGGWRMGWRRDGFEVFSTANDAAVLKPGPRPTEFSGFEIRRESQKGGQKESATRHGRQL